MVPCVKISSLCRHLWILFLACIIDIRPADLLTSPCQQSLIDQCGRLITGFTPQKYLSGLVPDSAIKDDCEAFASVRLCNDKVLRPCLAAELVTLDPFIRQANEFIMLFCENDQFRRDYAHHGQCLAVTSLDVNQCIANYGATVSDIAAISDNLTPQEVLHRSCCDGLHRLTQCAHDAAVRKCHPSSADFVKKFLYKMMKSTLQDWIARQCFEYQSQCNPGKDSVTTLDEQTNRQPAAFSSSTPESSFLSNPTVPIIAATTLAVTTGSTPSVTKRTDIVTVGTENVLSPARPEIIRLPQGNHTEIADDGAPIVGKSGVVIHAAVPVPDEAIPRQNHRPIAIKTAPEKSKSRIKNTTAITHPLARKFLLIISTIAFLAGWY